MNQISLGAAWREGLALLGQHRWVLLLYAVIGAVVPFFLLESEPVFNLRTLVAALEAPWAVYIEGSIKGPLYLLAIVIVIVTGAMFAAWHAILADIREGVSSEIMSGLVAGTAYLLFTLILYFAIGLIVTLPFLLVYGPMGLIGAPAWVGVLRQILSLVLSTWLSARFCLVGPVMAARGSLNPVAAYVESWRRTGSAQGRLFAFYLLFNLAVGASIGAFAALHIYVIFDNAAVLGTPQETAMTAGWVLLWSLLFLAYVLVPAALFRASEPGASGEVFA